jgi:hypothetical protein
MALFGNKVVAGVISYEEIKWMSLIQHDWCPDKKEESRNRET